MVSPLTIRHEVRIIIEIVFQSEGMSKFMGGDDPVKSARNPRIAIISFPLAYSCHNETTPQGNGIYTIVNDDEISIVRREIKCHSNLVKRSERVVTVAAIGVLPIYAVNQRGAVGIGFKAKGQGPMSMCSHLIAEKSLNLTDRRFHRIDHFLAKRAVIGQKVDHPHRAWRANIRVKRLLACSVKAIACSQGFKINGQTGMHLALCGWARRGPPDRRDAEQGENARAQHTWQGEPKK